MTVAFFGLPGRFAERPLRALAGAGLLPSLVVEGAENGRVARFPVRPGWWQLSRPPPAGSLIAAAHTLGVDGMRVQDPNHPDVLRAVGRLRPDALVVAGFHQPLGSLLIGLAARGGLKLHPGRLPEDRGPAPVFWALKAGRTELGWTVHMLEDPDDDGDIVASGAVSFTPGARAADVLAAMADAATPALVRAVRALLDGDLVRVPQAKPTGLRGPRPGFRDNRIDPGRPAEAVYTFVAGCAGRYPLFVESAGDRFFIADALSFDPTGRLGFEYALTGDRLLLRCHPGVVELLLREGGAVFAPDY